MDDEIARDQPSIEERMNITAKPKNRFEDDARRYAEYLETPEGRLRSDLTFANLLDVLPKASHSWHVLEVGCGTGATAVRLGHVAKDITLLDSSPAMLALASETVARSGLSDKTTLKQGDAILLAEILPSQSFDVVLCHNLLEYVADPEAVLRAAAHVMRNSSSILSVLVRNQAGEVLKAALQFGDLAIAEKNLAAEWGRESLYGGEVRFFTPDTMEAILKDTSLRIVARKGVRVVSDYLPEKISRSAQYDAIFSLERRLGQRREFFGVARYLHYLLCRE